MLKEDKEAAEKLSAIFPSAVNLSKPESGLTPQPFFTGERVGEPSQNSQQKMFQDNLKKINRAPPELIEFSQWV